MSLISRISDRSITVIIGGRTRSIPASSANYDALKEALKAPEPDIDLVKQLVDIPSFIAVQTNGRVQVSNDEVRLDGKPVHGLITTRILAHLHEGISITPLTNFLNLLADNPLPGVAEDLFEWLDRGDMPITDDGYIIAYKAVREDYYSHHSGKRGRVLHALNTVVTMPREEVDDNRRNECSYGLHFCSYGYLSIYNGGSKVIIVKINPADVVAIPTDYHRQKGRTWRMEVIAEVPREEMKDALVGRYVISEMGTYKSGVESTAQISDYNDNWLGDDKNGDKITEGRLRGLLAHGGIDYTAAELGIEVSAVSALVEKIDFPFENLGSIDKSVTSEPLDEIEDDDDDFDYADEEALLSGIDLATGDDDIDGQVQAELDNEEVLTFERDGRRYTINDIINGVEERGQRAYSADTGIPRSTLQGWLKQAREQQDKAFNSLSFGPVGWTAQTILDGVEQHGVTQFAKNMGVAKSTLQGWVAKARAAKG